MKLRVLLLLDLKGKALWFHCGFKNAFRQRFEICGSKKSIHIDDLVLPTDRIQYLSRSSGLTNHALLTFHDQEIVECDADPVHVSRRLRVLCRHAANCSSQRT